MPGNSAHVRVVDPGDVLPFTFEWAPMLAEFPGAPDIATSQWADPSGDLTLVNQGIVGTNTTVVVSGGTAGTDYVVTNQITIGEHPFTKEQSFTLLVREL